MHADTLFRDLTFSDPVHMGGVARWSTGDFTAQRNNCFFFSGYISSISLSRGPTVVNLSKRCTPSLGVGEHTRLLATESKLQLGGINTSRILFSSDLDTPHSFSFSSAVTGFIAVSSRPSLLLVGLPL